MMNLVPHSSPAATSRTSKALPFGQRLAALRRARGLTQTDLGEKVGISQRMVAYYEVQNGNPPATLLTRLARALQVTTDELIGQDPRPIRGNPRNLRLWRKLSRVEQLSPEEQKAVVQIIDTMLRRPRSGRAAR